MHTNRLLPLLLLAAGASPAAAQERMVIYRCTGADGAVIVQNDRPCPSGTTQDDRRVIRPAPAAAPPAATAAAARNDAPATTPAVQPVSAPTAGPPSQTLPPVPLTTAIPTTAPATLTVPPQTTGVPAPSALGVAPVAAETDRRPPPALFECRTPDTGVYLSEVATPAPRCAPLTTTGLGGTAPAAGTACEVVIDRCEPVAAGTLCDRWRQRLREMDAALTFGRLDERETATVEIDRVRSIVEDSVCGL
ncbi:DUF4124 domain-containing protein [Lysobacter korlensis]|uniref:DUF4124 domain-containing protein n=1 Tax=Lysobacter korlensis TaxID=553636 RepID=A0ABV6RJ52_9GAMM